MTITTIKEVNLAPSILAKLGNVTRIEYNPADTFPIDVKAGDVVLITAAGTVNGISFEAPDANGNREGFIVNSVSPLKITPFHFKPVIRESVQEYANSAAFPVSGESDTIYIDESAGSSYFWDGAAYVALGGAPTDVYPLDDDGTLAAIFGYGTASPPVGDLQRLRYESGGSAGVKLLMASNALTTGNFPRGTAPICFEAVSLKNELVCGLAISILDAGKSVVNVATPSFTSVGDLLQIFVAPDGTITALKNDTPYDFSGAWLNPAGQKTVGATDSFCPYLWVTDTGGSGDKAVIQLRVAAAQMLGDCPIGTKDIFGNLI